jgi:hypothetical protein
VLFRARASWLLHSWSKVFHTAKVVERTDHFSELWLHFRDRMFDTVTILITGRCEVPIPAGEEDIFVSQPSKLDLGPTQQPIEHENFLRSKQRPEREDDLSPPV